MDQFKDMFNIPGPTPLGYTAVARQDKVKSSLGVAIFLAVLLGGLNMGIGVLGILTFYNKGPLSLAAIPVEALSGKIINVSNIASLINLVVAVVCSACRRVYSGLSRSWLWRKASKGEGATVRQWRAAASGGSLRDVKSAPLLGGGIVIAAIGAAAIMAAAFSGILVPTTGIQTWTETFTGMAGYRGNSEVGKLISCITPNTTSACAPAFAFGAIGQAMALAAGPPKLAQHPFLGSWVYPTSSYYAGLTGILDGIGGISIPEDAYDPTYWAVGLAINVTCTPIYDVGLDSSTGQYQYQSKCLGRLAPIGDSSDTTRTYSQSEGCPSASEYTVEYAQMGALVTGDNKAFAWSCSITANEGMLQSSVTNSNNGLITVLGGFQPGYALTGQEVQRFASALVAVNYQDTAVPGKPGPIAYSTARNNTRATMEFMMGSGAATAAAAGYFYMLGPNDSTVYPVTHAGEYTYLVQVYAWGLHLSTLAWAVVAVLLGVVWLLAAFYMCGGGTAYDPTDWFHTMNTTAGSNVIPVGSSTAVGLERARHDKTMLWYGQIDQARVGFSSHPPGPVKDAKIYV